MYMSAQTVMACSTAEASHLEILYERGTGLMVVWMRLCFQQLRYSRHVLIASQLCSGLKQLLWLHMRHIFQGFSVVRSLTPSKLNMKSSSLR